MFDILAMQHVWPLPVVDIMHAAYTQHRFKT